MKSPSETTCAEVLSSLPLLVGGDLEPELARAYEAHVALCGACDAAWGRARRARAALAVLRPTAGMPDLWPGVRAALRAKGSPAGLAPERQTAQERATGGRAPAGARPAGPLVPRVAARRRVLRLLTPLAAVAAAVAFVLVLRDDRALVDEEPGFVETPLAGELAPAADPLVATPAVAGEIASTGLRRVGLDEPRLIETLEPQPVTVPVFLVPGAPQPSPLYDRPAGLRPAGNFR